jgi:hypothetical protein
MIKSCKVGFCEAYSDFEFGRKNALKLELEELHK